MTNYSWPPIVIPPVVGAATEAKQDAQIVLEAALNGKIDTLNAKDFSTAANQVTSNSSLSSIDTKLSSQATAAKQDSLITAIGLQAKLTDTQPVSIASIPLATGAATAANQATEISSLASIDTKLTSQATAALQGTGNTTLSSIDTKLTSQATAANQTAQITLFGAVTETAPASDTASSGLNGRLQRIAQRLTSLIALLPTAIGQQARAASLSVALSTEQEAQIGIITETAPATDTASSGLNGRLQRIAQRLTSLIALLPASLGQKTMANSLAVTLASDQSALSVSTTASSVAGTITTAQVTVGITAVRATVAGTAPSASRKRLSIKPSKNNSGAIYLGASGVTTANGLEIIGPDRLDFEFDAGDYYLISDTAAQVVEILEKA